MTIWWRNMRCLISKNKCLFWCEGIWTKIKIISIMNVADLCYWKHIFCGSFNSKKINFYQSITFLEAFLINTNSNVLTTKCLVLKTLKSFVYFLSKNMDIKSSPIAMAFSPRESKETYLQSLTNSSGGSSREYWPSSYSNIQDRSCECANRRPII